MWIGEEERDQFAADDRKCLGPSPGYDCGRCRRDHGCTGGHDCICRDSSRGGDDGRSGFRRRGHDGCGRI